MKPSEIILVTRWWRSILNSLRRGGACYKLLASAPDAAVRFAVVFAALLILFLRLPTNFIYPQFWAEDALIWMQLHNAGVSALWVPMAGYLLLAPKLVGVAAMVFPPAYAPAFYIYSAIAINLAIVWLATSPRLEIPFKPIVALAVVLPVQGIFTLGTLANVQWVLPLGAFLLLFMRSGLRAVIVVESVFAAIFSLTGPISIAAAPLFTLSLVVFRHDDERIHRLAILTVIVLVGAAIQATTMLVHLKETLTTGPQAAWSFSSLVVTPLNQALAPFGILLFRPNVLGVIASILASIALAIAAVRQPFALQKIFMLLFAGFVTVMGIIKSGPTFSLNNNLRYFYIASVMATWFLCCIAANARFRFLSLTAVCIFGVAGLSLSFNSASNKLDLHWRHWSSLIESGVPVMFASSPPGWYLEIPASKEGPLAQYSQWIGKDISDVSRYGQCADKASVSVSQIESARYTNVPQVNYYSGDIPRWKITVQTVGVFQVLALLDRSHRVLSFALPSHEKSTWVGIAVAERDELIKIMGFLDASHGCLLGDLKVRSINP